MTFDIPIFDIWCLVFDIRYLIFDIRCLYLVFVIWYSIFDSYPLSTFPYSLSGNGTSASRAKSLYLVHCFRSSCPWCGVKHAPHLWLRWCYQARFPPLVWWDQAALYLWLCWWDQYAHYLPFTPSMNRGIHVLNGFIEVCSIVEFTY